jgi:N6-adenosine-specific RNA methylase IME4
MSNEEVLDIDVGCLSQCGLIFLWVINSQMALGFECLNRWGYTYIDKVRVYIIFKSLLQYCDRISKYNPIE